MTEIFNVTVSALIMVIEAVGILVIISGFIIATLMYLVNLRANNNSDAYQDYRQRSVRGLILGLEFLIAADIIKTVVVNYSVNSMLMLGLIILIRTFLIFSLHMELDGKLPWVHNRK
ncbi:MAG: DUF1622 domain-containing protein, partial [Gammaproteobacteria bacterium]